MKQSCHRFGVLGALVSLMIACGGGGGGGGRRRGYRDRDS